MKNTSNKVNKKEKSLINLKTCYFKMQPEQKNNLKNKEKLWEL